MREAGLTVPREQQEQQNRERKIGATERNAEARATERVNSAQVRARGLDQLGRRVESASARLAPFRPRSD